MADDYLTTVHKEAEHVAEQQDLVARTTDNQAHEYLRYAILRILEGQADHLPTAWTPIDGVTVGYGSDDAMFDSWVASGDWWETVPPQEACARFQVLFPEGHQTVPRDIVDVMAALGAWRVWTGSAAACGSYDRRERREVHYLWPESHPVEEVLHERLGGPVEAVAPDGGRTGDVRDRLVVGDDPRPQDDFEPRTKRAVGEAMDVSLLSKGGRYEVESASGSRYEVDVVDESCSYSDWQQRSPVGGCEHLRRVDHEIERGRVPRPDGRPPTDATSFRSTDRPPVLFPCRLTHTATAPSAVTGGLLLPRRVPPRSPSDTAVPPGRTARRRRPASSRRDLLPPIRFISARRSASSSEVLRGKSAPRAVFRIRAL